MNHSNSIIISRTKKYTRTRFFGSKKSTIWYVEIDGIPYKVELHHSLNSGKRAILINDILLKSYKKFLDTGSNDRVTFHNKIFNITKCNFFLLNIKYAKYDNNNKNIAVLSDEQ